jgi:hypothetical protein
MYYYLVFQKEFADTLWGYGEQTFEWLLLTTQNKENALKYARKNNSDDFLNISCERFLVYQSEKLLKKNNKKFSKLIYPTPENPMFH